MSDDRKLFGVDIDNPDWSGAGRVHDWRNYIGSRTRHLWPSFTMEQRKALAQDADDIAGREEWE